LPHGPTTSSIAAAQITARTRVGSWRNNGLHLESMAQSRAGRAQARATTLSRCAIFVREVDYGLVSSERRQDRVHRPAKPDWQYQILHLTQDDADNVAATVVSAMTQEQRDKLAASLALRMSQESASCAACRPSQRAWICKKTGPAGGPRQAALRTPWWGSSRPAEAASARPGNS